MPKLRHCCTYLRAALAVLVLSLAMDAHAQRAAVPPASAPQGNCTHHDAATRPDCPAAIAFLAKFQDALKSNDKDAVASLVRYPLLVTTGGKRRVSRAQLLADFDHIFTPTLRAAILSATADDVWGNVHGFMVARGAIWFDTVVPRNGPTDDKNLAKYPVKLITINPVYNP
jgi:hypothetical protein